MAKKVKKIGTPGVDPERSKAMQGNQNASKNKGGARLGLLGAINPVGGALATGAYVAARKSERAVTRHRRAATAGGIALGSVYGAAYGGAVGAAVTGTVGGMAKGALIGSGVTGAVGGLINNGLSRLGTRLARPKKGRHMKD